MSTRTIPDGFAAFDSWEEVLAYAREHRVVWYHAPLSHYPSSVRAEVRSTNIRLVPAPREETDPFVRGAADIASFLKPGDRNSAGFRAAYINNGLNRGPA